MPARRARANAPRASAATALSWTSQTNRSLPARTSDTAWPTSATIGFTSRRGSMGSPDESDPLLLAPDGRASELVHERVAVVLRREQSESDQVRVPAGQHDREQAEVGSPEASTEPREARSDGNGPRSTHDPPHRDGGREAEHESPDKARARQAPNRTERERRRARPRPMRRDRSPGGAR